MPPASPSRGLIDLKKDGVDVGLFEVPDNDEVETPDKNGILYLYCFTMRSQSRLLPRAYMHIIQSFI
jgi:hypothetical protein